MQSTLSFVFYCFILRRGGFTPTRPRLQRGY